MGCCISTCNPRRTPQSNPSVQDKLVISQSPLSTPSYPPQSPPRKRKTVQSPPSTASASFTCSTQSSTCGSSSLSSVSSSSSLIAFSKMDRTFSNDFLQSCAMENPQIIGLDHPVKKIGVVKQLGPGNTLKRARASSPTLTRQKSFRIEKERLPCSVVVNGRSAMRSPSPSRRFIGDTSNNYQRQPMLLPVNRRNESNSIGKVNMKPASPNRNVISKEKPVYLKKKERFGYEVSSKVVEGVEVGEVLSTLSCSGSSAMEDLDNPHIALDCFIFL